MREQTMELARRGFAAWQRGDFDAVESLMDPSVRWRAHEPGLQGCDDHDEVMEIVRVRLDQGFSQGDLEFIETDGEAVIVVAHPAAIGGPEWPGEIATVLTFRDGTVVEMQDSPSKEDALGAAD
jgi:ketosteroid isomerase-like protein